MATSESDAPRFPRGSEWRRWDLHIHTPESVLNNQFGSNWDRYVHNLIVSALLNDVAVVGITDYFSIDGYRKLREEYLSQPETLQRLFAVELRKDPTFLTRVSSILFLPNIELRLDKLVPGRKDGKVGRLTMHVLFPDSLPTQEIQENFLGRLEFTYSADPQVPDQRMSLTRRNLEQLGRRLRTEHPKFGEHTDYFVGCMTATVDDGTISRLLAESFQRKNLLVLAEEYTSEIPWDGAGHQVRKVLLQKCDLMFSANPGTRKHLLSREFATEFGRPKACLSGSDAHSLDKLFQTSADRHCWIKADPTFAGLKQVVNEPASRSFVGDVPPALTATRYHRKPFIQRIAFRKRDGSALDENWFEGRTLEFNHSMVTIIGNKGAGKSALADTLALLGGSRTSAAHFSFLRPERFRKRDGRARTDRGEEFVATAQWHNGELIERSLAHGVSLEEVERVRYLPQGYLEKICNERDDDTASAFREELDRVIFSHVKATDRLGKETLAELIDYRTSEVKRVISQLKSELRNVNRLILQLEHKLSRTAMAALEEKIRSKERELVQLSGAAPTPVQRPTSDHNAAALKELDQLRSEQQRCEREVQSATMMLTKARNELATIEQVRGRLSNFRSWYARLASEIGPSLQLFGLSVSDVADAHVRFDLLDPRIAETKQRAAGLEAQLDPEQTNGPAAALERTMELIRKQQGKLDEAQQAYERYLTDKEAWEQRKKELTGTPDTPDTLEHYRAQKLEVDQDAPAQLEALKQQRREQVVKIHQEIVNQAAVYREYYEPALAFIKGGQFGRAADRFDVTLDVVIDGRTFFDRFFEFINQGSTGSFCGVAEGQRRLKDMLLGADFNTGSTTFQFLDSIVDALSSDLREAQPRLASLDRQLRKSATVKAFYDFLYSLDYLEPRYALRVGDKDLHELSPGERGLLLLVFYLVIDQGDSPLIIDQPEENLDNQSMNQILVPCIKAAKQRRQIFVVTHNPNVAVVCDSEQIVLTSIDKTNGYEISYSTGSIENGIMNRFAVDVLEGTAPAFISRGAKYRAGGSL